MEQSTIATINGIDIVTVKKDGTVYVPIRPICDALGIDSKVQRRKLDEHPILNSVGVIMTSTGADGKGYEMVCLPLKYIYGWLFTINPGKVAEASRDVVLHYQMECYSVLYDHFAGAMQRTIETNQTEIELLQNINSAISEEKEAKLRRKKAEEALAKLRAERLNPQPSLF